MDHDFLPHTSFSSNTHIILHYSSSLHSETSHIRGVLIIVLSLILCSDSDLLVMQNQWHGRIVWISLDL